MVLPLRDRIGSPPAFGHLPSFAGEERQGAQFGQQSLAEQGRRQERQADDQDASYRICLLSS